MELLATTDIPGETLGAGPRARRGETFTIADHEGTALIEAGLAVRADSADATFVRDARTVLTGKHER
jgi:hypothetical protein